VGGYLKLKTIFFIELIRTQINLACQIECKFYEKINLTSKMKEDISFTDPVLYSELLSKGSET
jgi:hypothetical protein